MQIIRGTTPTIIINVKDDIDFSQITSTWIFISQRGKVRVDKTIRDITVNPLERRIKLPLSQEDTLNLKEGDATIQVRILMSDGTALSSFEKEIEVLPTGKEGEIEPEQFTPEQWTVGPEPTIERIKLNLIPIGSMPVCHASQFDKKRQIEIEIYNGAQPYFLSDEELELVIKKPDGNLVSMDIPYEVGSNSVIFETTEQTCAVAGKCLCELRVTKEESKLGSLNFYLQVEGAPDEGGITSQSEINNLNRQITDEVDRILPEMVDEVAEPIVRELVPEVVGDNYYNKTQTDALLNDKADASDLQTLEDSIQTDYAQKLTQTLKVGENILTEASVVLGANWSGTLAGGFSHSSGSTEPLEFNVATTNNKAYLVTFNATNVNNASAITTRIGNTSDVDVYNGTTNFYIGIVSDGGNLIITPKSTYNGTITNLKLREVADEGDEVTFEAKNVNTKDNQGGLSGFWNVAIGADNFSKNENGSRNVAVGYASLNAFKSGTRNLALGTFAMNRLESGDMNISVGADSMWYAKKAKDCIAFGANSMSGIGTDIEHNIAIGQDALGGITTGKRNISIGFDSIVLPQNGNISGCTCVGAESGYYANTGSTFYGSRAGYHLKGVNNTCVGVSAGAQLNATGEYNVFIGVQCGIDNTGATSSNPKVVNNSIAIGRQARATKSYQMVLGSSEITEVVFCGNKKIKFNQDGTVTWEPLT